MIRLTRDAAWWAAAKTRGMDFRSEDLNDPAAFNRMIWEGMMGNRPYPARRSGGTPEPETLQVAKPRATKTTTRLDSPKTRPGPQVRAFSLAGHTQGDPRKMTPSLHSFNRGVIRAS
jgi:hypothetical protein